MKLDLVEAISPPWQALLLMLSPRLAASRLPSR